MFVGKDFKRENNNLIEHEIHTKGPPIRQNPEVRRHEQEQLKMLEHEIIPPSSSPWASPVVMVTKKRWHLAVLY